MKTLGNVPSVNIFITEKGFEPLTLGLWFQCSDQLNYSIAQIFVKHNFIFKFNSKNVSNQRAMPDAICILSLCFVDKHLTKNTWNVEDLY